MRKTIIRHDPENVSHAGQTWLDLDRLARIEFTSEEDGAPGRGGACSGPWGGLAGRTAGRAASGSSSSNSP